MFYNVTLDLSLFKNNYYSSQEIFPIVSLNLSLTPVLHMKTDIFTT